MSEIILYPNECVKRILAAIPKGHFHLRLVIETCDGKVMVFHEATVAAIVRAYVEIVTHPSRRGVEFVSVKLPKTSRKPGYAEWQLVESGRGEDEVVDEVSRLIMSAKNAMFVQKPSSQSSGTLGDTS